MTPPSPRVTGLALATPAVTRGSHREIDHAGVQRAARELLGALGADIDSEALQETPRRVADAFSELLTPQPFRATTFPSDDGYGAQRAKTASGRTETEALPNSGHFGVRPLSSAATGGCRP